MTRKIFALAATLATTLALAACDQDPNVAESDDPLYVKTSTIWPTGFIQVCWENPSTDPVKRAWVRDSVEQTWSQHGAVTFEGWGICTSGARGIRIGVSDERPHTDGLGREIDGSAHGMTLNFSFLNWNADPCSRSAAWLERCVRIQGIHEFGHALGFSHEQNRPDTPQSCLDEPGHDRQGENGNLMIGPWDSDSVMNYCNPRYNGGQSHYQLGAGDVRGLQQMYGRRTNHSFVGHGGHCLDIAGGVSTPGAYLQTWDCNNGGGQSWVPPFTGGPFVSLIGGCLYGYQGYPTMNSCLSPPDWYFTTLQLKSLGGKCIDLDDPSGSYGSGLHLQTCSATKLSQRFSINGGLIKSFISPYCLRGQLGVGSRITLGYCSDYREWTMQIGNFAHSDGTCMSLQSVSTDDGTPLAVERCSSGLQEQFNLTGQLTSNAGTCLEIATDTTLPVTPVDVAPCRSGTAGENQLWDYYW